MSDDTKTAELSQLCAACGLCCDGTLFAFVPLEEADQLKPEVQRRLRMVPDRKFAQPCAARADASCAIYADRPTRCRSYRCTLLTAHAEEGGPVEPRLEKIRRTRLLADRLRARLADHQRQAWLLEGVATLLEQPAASIPAELRLDVAELSIRLQRDFGKKP